MNTTSDRPRHNAALPNNDSGRKALLNWYAEQARILADKTIALAFDCQFNLANQPAGRLRQAAAAIRQASNELRS